MTKGFEACEKMNIRTVVNRGPERGTAEEFSGASRLASRMAEEAE
ncbi:MAG: hypothetical protein ACLVHQ_06950 [Oscillospiraceae bacterium]